VVSVGARSTTTRTLISAAAIASAITEFRIFSATVKRGFEHDLLLGIALRFVETSSGFGLA
jgi:hypothetical protein